ncbi:MAG: thiamine pyrophosphate-dependent enzyme [Tissierellia bacterium]|nr:thiamine pyrophosphate-dependent enzyme [Tissierellia bacterium]
MGEYNLLSKGLTTCEGCPMELIARHAIETLGEKTVTMTPPSCSAILTGGGDETGWGVPSVQTMLMSLPAYASGVSEALKIQGKNEVNIMGFAGDGGTFDIGFQSLSGAIERGHKAIFICYNNEAYMNTGNQRSSATTLGAYTKTTPTGKKEQSKNIDFMLLHTPLAYQATASVSNIKDLRRKIAKAATKDGPSFIHVLAPCHAGWKMPPRKMVEVGRLAVQSGIWPLFEREDGKITINSKPKDYELIREYIGLQGRFDRIDEETIVKIIENAKIKYRTLESLSKLEELA